MRPKSIIAFEAIAFAQLGLSFAVTAADDFIGSLLTSGALLTLVLFITRRASSMARWLYIGMFFAGLVMMGWMAVARPSALLDQPQGRLIGMALSTLTSIVLIWLLVSPTASRWLALSKPSNEVSA
jgi:hypothetical protein